MDKLKRWFILMTLVAMVLQLGVARISTAFAYSGGDVVINEISWAGSVDSFNDEYIELYNTTNQTIDLTGWYIEDDATMSYTITSGTIAPHGYFLIEDSEEAVSSAGADAVINLSLANAGDSLILKDNAGVAIDVVNGSGGAWYAGDSTTKATMERVDPNVTVDTADNWADAQSSNGALASLGSAILGTPGSVNSNYAGSGTEVVITPASTDANFGEFITLSVDTSSAVDLYAFGFDISYDPAVLNFVSATEGNFLSSDGQATAFSAALEDGVQGTLIAGGARLINPPSGIDGSGKLFDMTFEVVGADGSSSALTFGANSYLADSVSDMPVLFSGAGVSVGGATASPVANLLLNPGVERYSLELTWDANGADSYIVNKQMPDGSFVMVDQVTAPSFVDNNNLVPGVNYAYQVIAVSGATQSAPVEVSGPDGRGLLGDVDRSDRVDGRDIEKLARSFGSTIGDEEYDPLNDTNYDGVIDGSDLIDIGMNFGLTYP